MKIISFVSCCFLIFGCSIFSIQSQAESIVREEDTPKFQYPVLYAGPPQSQDTILCVSETTYITIPSKFCSSVQRDNGKKGWGQQQSKKVAKSLEILILHYRQISPKDCYDEIITSAQKAHYIAARLDTCMLTSNNETLAQSLGDLLQSEITVDNIDVDVNLSDATSLFRLNHAASLILATTLLLCANL